MWRGGVIGASAEGTIVAPCGAYPVEPIMIGRQQKK